MKEINITPKELEDIYDEILKEISSQNIVQKIIYICGETNDTMYGGEEETGN